MASVHGALEFGLFGFREREVLLPSNGNNIASRLRNACCSRSDVLVFVFAGAEAPAVGINGDEVSFAHVDKPANFNSLRFQIGTTVM